MPAWLASDLYDRHLLLEGGDAGRVVHRELQLLCPCVMPVPHLAGSWQVITPPTSVQPWLVSSDLALAMLNGYGPCPLL